VESAPVLPKQSIERAGIGAWNGFSPVIHPKTLGRVLSQMRFGSTINLVGPLLNPTMPAYKVMGVPHRDAIDIAIKTLRELDFERGFVMHGIEERTQHGMDELSTLGPSHVSELFVDGSIESYVITPDDLGLRRARFEDLASSRSVQTDAMTLLRVIMGLDEGPRSDIICLNAAPLLYIMGKAKDLRAGIDMAREVIVNGRALDKLRAWVSWQNTNPDDGLTILDEIIRRAA
jgi:anthranilate phosphoribosyltransferase